jgi:hypothetical protein
MGQPQQDSNDRTIEIEQLEQDNWDSTVGTGQSRMVGLTDQTEHDREVKIARS